REAEAHAEEDKMERARIDARNEADSLIYSTEKSLKEYGDKITSEDKATIESAISDLKHVLENQSASAEEIKAKNEALQQASYKLAEEVYKQSAAQGADASASQSESTSSSETSSKKPAKDGVEDADFEVVD
ncbi:MAG: Hsp70 family protein, partial [Sphaerochaeta sp.]|uniref:Hsp70 family protein n=1 Tax=Sphaerochaeta sp. TaxID=1972642 RepID=UPI003D12604D